MIAGTEADARPLDTLATAVAQHDAGSSRIDKVGALIAALAVFALVFQPFVTFRDRKSVV